MIKIKKICKSFLTNTNNSKNNSDDRKKVLVNLDFDINKGDFIHLKGENGSGKTTFIKIIKNIILPDSGIIESRLDDCEITLISQNVRSFFYNLTCMENLNFFNSLHRNPSDFDSKDFEHLLNLLGLEKKLDLRVSKLSSGEVKRLMILRGMLNNPKLILLDEIENSLDKKFEDSIINFFNQINKERDISILWVSHKESISKNINRITELKNGKIFE